MTHTYTCACAGPGASLAAVGALAGFMTLSGGKVIDGTACGSNCMAAAFMSPELHERGIHAVSCGAVGPGRGNYETGRAGGTRGGGCIGP